MNCSERRAKWCRNACCSPARVQVKIEHRDHVRSTGELVSSNGNILSTSSMNSDCILDEAFGCVSSPFQPRSPTGIIAASSHGKASSLAATLSSSASATSQHAPRLHLHRTVAGAHEVAVIHAHPADPNAEQATIIATAKNILRGAVGHPSQRTYLRALARQPRVYETFTTAQRVWV